MHRQLCIKSEDSAAVRLCIGDILEPFLPFLARREAGRSFRKKTVANGAGYYYNISII